MVATASPLQHDEEGQDPVTPVSSAQQHTTLSTSSTSSTSSIPAVSVLVDASPHHLCFPPTPPTPPTPPRPPSVSSAGPPPPDMALHAACFLESISPVPHATPVFDQVLPERTSPPAVVRSQTPQEVPSPAPTEDRIPLTPLSDVTHLLRLQKYHKRRSIQAKESLHYLQIAASKTARLSQAARSLHHTLAECIKVEDRNSFVNLLHAFQDACDDALRPTHSILRETTPGGSIDPRPASPFLHHLSAASRTTVLDILSKVRYDGTFIADCLASLTPKELVGLLPERSVGKSSDSVFGPSRSTSRTSRPLGYVVDAQVDLLSSYAYGSPLETLVYAPRAFSRAEAAEDTLTTDVWATVCARLISDQKHGSEKLIPAVLDIWTSHFAWPGKDRIEVWILQTIQAGAFLLEQASKQTFRARMESRPEVSAEDVARADTFYQNAADSLLDLFGDQAAPSALPPGALKLCHSISDKLRGSPGHQRVLPQFIMIRWLSSFIMDLVTLPEAHGMMTDHYIPDNARQKILSQVVNRAQKAVFDVSYSWKYGNSPPAETVNRVNAIMARFHAYVPGISPTRTPSTPAGADHFLAISIKDATTILSSLYPQRRPASVSSDFDSAKGLQSSASSISGFSLFRNVRASESFPQLSTSISLDVQYLGIADTEARPMGMEEAPQDDHRIREARVELDDFATSHATTSEEFWDVLVVSSQALLPMREKQAELRSVRREKKASTAPSDRQDVVPPSRLSCARTLEALLYEYGGHLSVDMHSLAHETDSLPQIWNQFERMFEQAIVECESRSDFVGAHQWFDQLHSVHLHVFECADLSPLRKVLIHLECLNRTSIDEALELESACEGWTASLKTGLALKKEILNPILARNEQLRDKMWYVADVRTSAAYDEARCIANALKIMGKPKRHTRPRQSPPLRHWNTPKLSPTSLHLKTEAHILDILSAKPEHGGSNKLSDDQARTTSQWMERESIVNLCKGEERLHRLCMEIRRCVDQVTAHGPSENSTLWCNTLFSRDGSFRHTAPLQRKPTLLSGLYGETAQPHFLSLSSQLRSTDALSNASHTLSSVSSRDYLDSRSPTLTNKSSIPFWSPAMTEVDAPSSATSVISSQTQSAMDLHSPKHPVNSLLSDPSSLDKLRQRVASLVLSDLTSVLFSDGSESDGAFWTGLGLEIAERHFRTLQTFHTSAGSQTPTTDAGLTPRPSIMRFGFDNAFQNLLQRFSALCNPATKLACLYHIDRLLIPYMVEQGVRESPSASCTRSAAGAGQAPSEANDLDANDTSVAGFRKIFLKSSLRPSTIFRDLQYIASLVPSTVLQTTAQGKAFANAVFAITGLKNEARGIMVETADSIIAYHSNNRGHGRTSSTAQQQRDSATFSVPSRTPSAEDIARYTMSDAAHLYQIAAKEGDHVAQRELATLYLTHPELMDHVIAPFARPRDVFKGELEDKWRKNQDPNKCDPLTMCVAHHWMGLSAKGGDTLAMEILKQGDSDGSIWGLG